MLLFQQAHIPGILNGTKTQTRRLWKTPRVKARSLHKCYSGGLPISRCSECNGMGFAPNIRDDCPVCHGTGRLQPFATVRIKRVWQEWLEDISDRDARAESYADRMNYLAAFYLINQRRLPSNVAEKLLVWAVEFELVERGTG